MPESYEPKQNGCQEFISGSPKELPGWRCELTRLIPVGALRCPSDHKWFHWVWCTVPSSAQNWSSHTDNLESPASETDDRTQQYSHRCNARDTWMRYKNCHCNAVTWLKSFFSSLTGFVTTEWRTPGWQYCLFFSLKPHDPIEILFKYSLKAFMLISNVLIVEIKVLYIKKSIFCSSGFPSATLNPSHVLTHTEC